MEWPKIVLDWYKYMLIFIPRLLLAIVILFVGLWLIRRIKHALRILLNKKDIDPTLRPFLLSFSTIAFQLLLLLGIMNILGLQMTIFAAFVGAFGVAAGLALSGTLQNFTSGILILLLKPFRVGDIIFAQGHEGTVNSIQIFYTLITTHDNRSVILPNSKLSNEVIVNLSRQGLRRFDIELKFGNAVSFNDVKIALETMIKQNKDLIKEPSFRIGISSIDPDGYKVMFSIWVQAHVFNDSKIEIQKRLMHTLIDAGLKTP